MSAPVVAFDVNVRKGGRIKAVRKFEQKISTHIAMPDTAQDADDKAPNKVAIRSELASVYAGQLGVEVPALDISERLELSNDPLSLDAMVDALPKGQLNSNLVKARDLKPQHWPALAVMTGGQLILVLSQTTDTVTIYDADAGDKRFDVAIEEFAPHYQGQIIKAEKSVQQLAAHHAPEKDQSHWFWGQFGKFRRQLAEIALGSLVANVLAVAVALFSLQVYDRVIPHQSSATLWVLAIGAGLAILMEAFLKGARARLMDGAGRRIEMSVQKLLMDRVLGMRSGGKNASPSTMFSAMREFSSVREFFTASTIGGLADIPFIFVFLLLVSSIAGNLVWVLVLGGILMVVPGFLLQKRMMALTEQTQGAAVKSSRMLHEVIYDADTVKAQRAEERFARLWEELTALSSLKSSEQRKLASALTFWSQGVQQATYIAAVVVGTFLVFAGEFTVGSIIAVGILTSRTLAPLSQLAGTMARWSNVKTALDGLDKIAGAEQSLSDDRTYLRREEIQGAFELNGVSYRYDDEGSVNVDVRGLAIKAGQRVAVLGPNGSGKSTFLKLLSGLYAPSEGRILVDGVEMEQIHPKDLRRNIGYLGQEVKLFTGTLRDNLNLSMLERDDARLFEALDFAGLGKYVRSHPKGLDLAISDRGEGLSIGQRQSIGWARVWLQDPKICLLDEPTAALDQTLENTLVSRLETWLEGRTAIIATHRMPILQLTDRTVILQDGKLIVDGPRDEVLAHIQNKKASA